jgi:hypothetical protein
MLALTILGNNSAIPAFGRHPTAQVLQTDNDSFLIDCGEGTQTQLTKFKIRKSKFYISSSWRPLLWFDRTAYQYGLVGAYANITYICTSTA